MNELTLRIFTGIVLSFLLGLALFYFSSPVFITLLGVIWMLGNIESIKLCKPSNLTIVLAMSLFVLVLWFVFHYPFWIQIQGVFLVILAQIMMKYGTSQDALLNNRSVIYIAYGLCFTLAIAAIGLTYQISPWHAAGLFCLTAITDIGGYFAGKSLGKNKLCPALSPGKTIEGSMGGLALVVLFSLAAIWYFELPLLFTLLLSVVTSWFAVMGDLLESWIKRLAGAKNSGSLLPGHGGILDRVDALVLAAPIYYMLLQW